MSWLAHETPNSFRHVLLVSTGANHGMISSPSTYMYKYKPGTWSSLFQVVVSIATLQIITWKTGMFHQTFIKNWLFRVPGMIIVYTYINYVYRINYRSKTLAKLQPTSSSPHTATAHVLRWSPRGANSTRICVTRSLQDFPAFPTWMSQEISKWFVNSL